MGVFFGDAASAVEFSYDGSAWSTAKTSVSNLGSISAYTPWYEGYTQNSVTILADQGSAENIRKSDFLYAEGENATLSGNELNLTFKHRLSQLIINYTYVGSLEKGNAPTDVKVKNQPLTYSISGDTWVASNSNSDITPLVSHDSGSGTGTIEAILVPQSIDSNSEFITFTINSQSYKVPVAGIKFESGAGVEINLNIGSKNAEITDITCSADWHVTSVSGTLTEIKDGYEIVDGTYYIYNAKGLEAWRGEAAVKNESTGNQLVCADAVLMNDIDMKDIVWPSCCRGSSGLAYTGTFDGNGHTISNLTVHATWAAVGFIGSVSTGTVKNLTINGINVTTGESQSASNMGAVVGEVTDENGNIDNCHVIFKSDSRIIARKTDDATYDKQGTYNAGGIVGLSYGNITCCTVKADAPAQNGGEIGFSNTPDNYHIQSITYAGGVAGKVYADIENCHVDGIHLFCTTSGGIVGETNANNINSVMACSAKNVVIRGFMGTNASDVPSGLSVRAGGIVGRSNKVNADTDKLHVAGCYAIGTDIQFDTNQSGSQAGGLVGRCQSGMVYITSSYSASANLIAYTVKTIIAHSDGHLKQVAALTMIQPAGVTTFENQGTQLDDISKVTNNIATYNSWLTDPNQSNRGISFAEVNWQYVASDNNPFPMIIQPKN